MAYDPYHDIVGLLDGIKKTTGGVSAQAVADLIKTNNSVYRSTYREIADRSDKTADYIKNGEAYRDAGAQAIRAVYADYAGTAQGHAAAEGAADNGGNLDTYAAAQANRAAAAMLDAGEAAVAKRADAIGDALIASDKNATAAAGDMMGALGKDADTLAGTAKAEAQAAANARSDALSDLLNLYGVLNKPIKA